MASKQLEAVTHLLYEARDLGVDLRRGLFNPRNIREIYSSKIAEKRQVTLVGLARVIHPDLGNLSWGYFMEGDQDDGIQPYSIEGMRRNCNVGVLVADNQFEVLQIPPLSPESNDEQITVLNQTGIVVPAVCDPTVAVRAA